MWLLIGKLRAFRLWRVGGEDKMQATEANIGSEPGPEVRVREKETQMQDVLSRCRPLFYRKAYRQLGNAADAEDAVQDALLSAYKHLDQFKGQAQMSTWLTAIVTHRPLLQIAQRPRPPHLHPNV